MHSDPPWYPYIQKLIHQDLHLKERIEHLEQMIRQMKREITDLKERKQFNVERIEYRFDQLKIEQLEGTLNIGITPEHAEDIENYAVHQKEIEDLEFSQTPLKPEDSHDALFQSIYDQTNDYLQEETPKVMETLGEKYQIELGSEYERMMIEDVKKQLNRRIRHYLQQKELSDLEPIELEKKVVEKTKSDINWAMEQHCQKIKQQGE